MAEKPDYYAVLGVAKTATKDEIEKAYKAFAFKNHPDRLRGKSEAEIKQATAKLSQATEAKIVLTDPAKRRTYDSYGHDGLARMANGSSAGTGQSYAEAAGPVREREKLSGDALFDFFDKRTERRQNEESRGDGLTSAERRARAADQRVADRKARLNSGGTPPAQNNGTPPATPAPATPPTSTPTSPRNDFKDTAQKVDEAVGRLKDSGIAAVPVDVLVKFRENLQDFIDEIDNAIEAAQQPPKNGTRKP